MFIVQPHHYRSLIPVPIRQWREPSQAQPKDQFGNQDCTRFRLTARLNDGFIKWRGWFDSREDADAFLYALARNIACQELIPRSLWELPIPAWHPGIGPWVTYEFVTQSFLTATPGSNQTFTSPPDWNNTNNTVETIAGGASGAIGGNGNHTTGGGGGAWNQISNFNFASPGTTTATYQLGLGGAIVTASGFGPSHTGNNGGDTWFNATTLAGCSVGSKAGGKGQNSIGSTNGGTGGVGASGVGTLNNDGGRGGNLTGSSGAGATGGGGAAGSNGAGNNGVDSTATGPSVVTAGGSGDAGLGGTGGPSTAPRTAGNGSEYDATHGSGGGGGANSTLGPGAAGGGGNYGGGGGGINSGGSDTVSSGAGIQGMIAFSWTGPPLPPTPWSPQAILGPMLAI